MVSLIQNRSNNDEIDILKVNELRKIIDDIKMRNIDVCIMALDSKNKMKQIVILDSGIFTREESVMIYDHEAHYKWTQAYPHGYAKNDIYSPYGYNEVRQSMTGIGTTISEVVGDNKPLMIVPSIRLSNIPYNIFLINEQIKGGERPIAVTPSLSWLCSSLNNKREKTKRNISWIPQSDDEHDALAILLEEMTPILSEHNIEIKQNATYINESGNYDIAIIGAHGSIYKENEFLRVVSNGREINLSTRDFALRYKNSKLVILFMCSGGRLDENPFSASTIGLPHILLHLGCRAVIASPWPIQPSIAQYWLTEFLKQYKSGTTVIEANFYANKSVASEMNHPMAALAMHLYGDPFTHF